MELEGTHFRQVILGAVESAAASVPSITGVATASSYLESPGDGAIADISFMGEKSEKISGFMKPGEGIVQNTLKVGIVLAANLTNMDVNEFEGSVIGDFHRAVMASEDLAYIAHDFFFSSTEWDYYQDEDGVTGAALLILDVIYQTPVANPGIES